MRHTSTARLLLLLALAAFLMSGCGLGRWMFGKKKPERPPEVMAKEGIEKLKKRNYLDAAETFTKIKDRYPYSEQALVAQIKLADSLYYNKKFDEALAAYKEFEKLHPTNPSVPYVIYQQGLSYYRQRPTIDRDQTFTNKALAEFRRLQQKFPKTEYAAKADRYKQRCLEDLAEHEFYVGEFYFRTKRYPSALDRFQALSQEHPSFKTSEVKDYIRKTQDKIAHPEKSEGFISRLFDAQW